MTLLTLLAGAGGLQANALGVASASSDLTLVVAVRLVQTATVAPFTQVATAEAPPIRFIADPNTTVDLVTQVATAAGAPTLSAEQNATLAQLTQVGFINTSVFPVLLADQTVTLALPVNMAVGKVVRSLIQNKTPAGFTNTATALANGITFTKVTPLAIVQAAVPTFPRSTNTFVSLGTGDRIIVMDIYTRTLVGTAATAPDVVTVGSAGTPALYPATKLVESTPGGVGGRVVNSRWAVSVPESDTTAVFVSCTWSTCAVNVAVLSTTVVNGASSAHQSVSRYYSVNNGDKAISSVLRDPVVSPASRVLINAFADSSTGTFPGAVMSDPNEFAVAYTARIIGANTDVFLLSSTQVFRSSTFYTSDIDVPGRVAVGGYPWAGITATEFVNTNTTTRYAAHSTNLDPFTQSADIYAGQSFAVQQVDAFTQAAVGAIVGHAVSTKTLDGFLTTPDVLSLSTYNNNVSWFVNDATFIAGPQATANKTMQMFFNKVSVQAYQATPDTGVRLLGSNTANFVTGEAPTNWVLHRFTSGVAWTPDAALYTPTIDSGYTPNYLSNFGRFKNGSFGVEPGSTVEYADLQMTFTHTPKSGMYEVSFWFYVTSPEDTMSLTGLADTQGGAALPQTIFKVETQTSGRLRVSGWGSALATGKGAIGSNYALDPESLDVNSRQKPSLADTLHAVNYGAWNHVVLMQNGTGPIAMQLWLNGQRDLTFVLDDIHYAASILNAGKNKDQDSNYNLDSLAFSASNSGDGYAAIDEVNIWSSTGNPGLSWYPVATGQEVRRGQFYPERYQRHNLWLDNIWVPDRAESTSPWNQLVPPFTQSAVLLNFNSSSASALAQTTATAALSLIVPLAAGASANSSVTANLTGQLAASISAQATATAALAHGVPLASTGAASATATAALVVPLVVPLATAAAASASATSALTEAVPLAASAAGQGAATASLSATNQWLIAASPVAAASASASLAHGVPLATSAAGSAASTSALANSAPLAAAGQGGATATATATRGQGLGASAASAASASASLFIVKALADAAVATASVSASLSLAKVMAAVAQAQASASATVSSRFIYDARRGIVVPPEDRKTTFTVEARALIPLPP